jgi:hypothetical protein|tara:strand:+ start:659 stop:1087 length:429 start_codon:yes stop_codon:yes gene_type:complete
MSKKLLIILFVLVGLNYNLQAEESFIRVNPKLKLGKVENGNHFFEFVPAKFNWRINKDFSIAGGASVGFTAPRSHRYAFNHFSNRLTVRATYRPSGKLGYFIEGNFANKIDGAHSSVNYFHHDTYQAVGIEYEWFELKGKES